MFHRRVAPRPARSGEGLGRRGAAGRRRAARSPTGGVVHHGPHQAFDLAQFLLGTRREVLVRQHLDRAVAHDEQRGVFVDGFVGCPCCLTGSGVDGCDRTLRVRGGERGRTREVGSERGGEGGGVLRPADERAVAGPVDRGRGVETQLVEGPSEGADRAQRGAEALRSQCAAEAGGHLGDGRHLSPSCRWPRPRCDRPRPREHARRPPGT